MDLSSRIAAFRRLGDFIKDFLAHPDFDPQLQHLLGMAEKENPWFTRQSLEQALRSLAGMLEKSELEAWCEQYPEHLFKPLKPRTVGTVMAGNIPMVGFHDFLAILISGHRFAGKLSGKDRLLLPYLADRLIAFEPGLGPSIRFEEGQLKKFDAIIATGSNNATRYFQYYFGKYPHIFRRNRNGVAVLTGRENPATLNALADDVFLYFGLGCRNVSMLFVPEGYDFQNFFEGMEAYHHLIDHHKYANNYQYHRSVWLMNAVDHLDNGFLLLRHDPAIASAVATLHYQTYDRLSDLPTQFESMESQLQCIVTEHSMEIPTVPPGQSQWPRLWDYADGVDTLEFLSNLS